MKNDEYPRIMFKRGYIISEGPLPPSADPWVRDVLAGWTTLQVGPFELSHDNSIGVSVQRTAGCELALIGTAVDPFEMLGDTSLVTARLHLSLESGRARMLEYLDNLTGRFLVLAWTDSDAFVLQDATGIRSCFYDIGSDRISIASHCALCASAGGWEPTARVSRFIADPAYSRLTAYLPGVRTPYRQVRMLTPNTLLDLREKKIERFYPQRELTRRTIQPALVEDTARLFKNTTSLLAENYRVAIPVTGGMDSSITLAACREAGLDGPCYTYTRTPENEADAACAARNCANLGFRHRTVPAGTVPATRDDRAFVDAWDKSMSGMRNAAQGLLCKALLESFNGEFVHLKSTVSEIGRAFYKKKARLLLPAFPTPSSLARCYPVKEDADFVKESFVEYMETVEFTREAVFNYDPYDIFYWEHRNGNWQALTVLECDPALDTFILYNNRRLLEMFLSVPLADRINDRLHSNVLQALLPRDCSISLNRDAGSAVVRYAQRMKRRIEALRSY